MGYQEMGVRIAARRRELGLTQKQLAEQMEVTAQSVSAWERCRTVPEAERLEVLADVLQISVSSLLEGCVPMPREDDDGRLDDVEQLRKRIADFAAANGLRQTTAALSCAIRLHSGQYRKGIGEVPYVVHPMDVACHAMALGIREDAVLAAALLHDVCEDCGVSAASLPVEETVRKSIKLLTFTQVADESWDDAKDRYYAGIYTSREAMLVKLLDRCNNVSGMASGFTPRRMGEYVQETREHVLPLIPLLLEAEPQWRHALWLIRYQLESLLHTFDHLL